MCVGTDQLQYAYCVTFTYHHSSKDIISIAFNTGTHSLPWFFKVWFWLHTFENNIWEKTFAKHWKTYTHLDKPGWLLTQTTMEAGSIRYANTM